MAYFNWWPGLTLGALIGILLALLCIAFCVGWQGQRLWRFRKQERDGDLLLQVEINGVLSAHVAMLTAEARAGKVKYIWPIVQIHRDDFPYTQMIDLPFTHIVVTQKRTERNLITISVIDRPTRLGGTHFYWIKNAAIGSQLGFPSKLLLPHNLILKYLDSAIKR